MSVLLFRTIFPLTMLHKAQGRARRRVGRSASAGNSRQLSNSKRGQTTRLLSSSKDSTSPTLFFFPEHCYHSYRLTGITFNAQRWSCNSNPATSFVQALFDHRWSLVTISLSPLGLRRRTHQHCLQHDAPSGRHASIHKTQHPLSTGSGNSGCDSQRKI